MIPSAWHETVRLIVQLLNMGDMCFLLESHNYTVTLQESILQIPATTYRLFLNNSGHTYIFRSAIKTKFAHTHFCLFKNETAGLYRPYSGCVSSYDNSSALIILSVKY